jgi:hypothetical protein
MLNTRGGPTGIPNRREDKLAAQASSPHSKNESFGVDIAHLDEEDVALAGKKEIILLDVTLEDGGRCRGRR